MTLNLNGELGPRFNVTLTPKPQPLNITSAQTGSGQLVFTAPAPQPLTLTAGIASSGVGGVASLPGWAFYSFNAYALSLTANQRTKIELSNLVLLGNNLLTAYQGHNFFQGGDFVPITNGAGGKYRMRVSTNVTSVVESNALRFELQVAGTNAIIAATTQDAFEDAGTPERFSGLFDFFIGSIFIDESAEVYVTSKADCTLADLDIALMVEMVG